MTHPAPFAERIERGACPCCDSFSPCDCGEEVETESREYRITDATGCYWDTVEADSAEQALTGYLAKCRSDFARDPAGFVNPSDYTLKAERKEV